MDIRLYHDSQKSEFKSIFGAVRAGETVVLRILISGNDHTRCSVTLRIWKSNDGEHLIPMERDGEYFAAAVDMPDEGALLWYYFIVEYDGGKLYYGNNKDGLGGIGAACEQEPPSFQITVYDKDAVTPDWFKHAIVYQIFPDRFCRGTSAAVTLQGKKGAVIHSCWDDVPYYCKAPNGTVVQYDFFGGNLAGIREKLPYLKKLGITALYLNPVFESCSNHRYDTGDYYKIDPFLGTNEEFAELCSAAKQEGIHVIIDGVFSHTGEDSRYFNKFGKYPTVGAYQSKESPYYEWYNFTEYPDTYECWWGVDDLPNVKETTPSYMDFIINNADSVLKYWLRQGISGWRLDVIDELPESFLRRFYHVLKEENPDAVLIGEVWEDASNKMSYGQQREYLSGKDIDSAMNYALRTIMVDFIMGRKDGNRTAAEMMHQVENYPKENFYAMLNLIGSHDVERILTILGSDGDTDMMTAEEKAEARLALLAAWQMTMPGAPCIYYGDEAGVCGTSDPDNRRTYPWGRENKKLLERYMQLTTLRRSNAALQTGRFIPLYGHDDIYAYARSVEGGRDVFGKPAEDGCFVVVMNRNATVVRTVSIYTEGLVYGDLYDAFDSRLEPIHAINSRFTVTLPPLAVTVLKAGEVSGAKRAGILFHPTSLPSPYGMGDLGDEALRFIDFLEKAGQKVWQILPLTPPGKGNSPYLSVSAFAGNERLISLEKLVRRGWLSDTLWKQYRQDVAAASTYEEKWQCKKKCLWYMSHDKKLIIPWKEFDDFCHDTAYWINDYALFSAVHDFYRSIPWTQWPENIRRHEPAAVQQYKKELSATVSHYMFLQYIFYVQWQDVKTYAHQKGITILGDIPIFVAHDSAACWAHQALFDLDDGGDPVSVSGVPPDYFSADGQLWGNPLYRWDVMAEDGYDWWIHRFRWNLNIADELRIDHFRGFAAYWSVPADAENARNGVWKQGPGIDFFRVLYDRIPDIKLVAENLGVITDDVCELKDTLHLPGMKVLQFHMKERADGCLSFDTEPNCIAYTGTHDNDTLVGWYTEELDARQRRRLCVAVGIAAAAPVADVVRAIIAYVYSRRAETVIVPLRDILCLPSSCRMNRPGTSTGNWLWEMGPHMLTDAVAQWLAQLCRQYGR